MIKPKFLGIYELDELLGGIPPNYSLLVVGPPGSGKTSLALSMSYRNACDSGSKVLYVTTNEGKSKLESNAGSLGIDLREPECMGGFTIVEFPTLGDECLIDSITKEITKHVLDGYDMVVIDSVTPLMKMLGTYMRKRAWLHTVLYKLATVHNVFMVLVADDLGRDDQDVSLLEYLVDVVVRLEHNPGRLFPRILRLTKFRARPVPELPVYFTMTNKGIRAVNIVTDEEARKFRAKKKSIPIEEGLPQELFGEEIRPGTQIAVIVKEPASNPGRLLDYLVLKAANEILDRGIKVGHIMLDSGRQPPLKIMAEISQAINENFILVSMDVTSLQIPLHLARFTEGIKDVDLLFVCGYGRLAEFYGPEEVNHLIAVYHQIDSKLGIVTIRIYNVPRNYPRPPSSMLTMSDVVLLVTRSRERDAFVIDLVKGTHTTKPVTILDTELEGVVNRLKIKLATKAEVGTGD